MSGKFRYAFLLVIGLVVIAFAARVDHTEYTAYIHTDSSSDTTQVFKIVPYVNGDSLGMDSNIYLDTFVVGGTDSLLIGWTAPVQVMIITPTVDQATTYSCSVAFVSEPVTLGVEKDYASGVATVAALIDTLVDLINGKAGLTDSVTAEDSVTYIKLVSNFSQETFEGRWSMINIVAGGAGTLDTASAITTPAIVTAALTTAINDSTDLAVYVTAYDSTSFIEVHSDDKGLEFLVFLGDSATDTVSKQANVAGYSSYQDTFKVARMIWGDFEVSGIDFWAKIDTSATVAQGLGNADSGYIWIYKVRTRAGEGRLTLVDSVASNAIPCSLHVLIIEDTTAGGVGADSMWCDYWNLVYRVADSVSDTVLSASYTIYVDYKLIGK